MLTRSKKRSLEQLKTVVCNGNKIRNITTKKVFEDSVIKTNKHIPIKITTMAMIATIPAGRLGKSEEIAALIAFLASPSAGYISGTSIPVDGGRTGAF